jgi:hypothetical protein
MTPRTVSMHELRVRSSHRIATWLLSLGFAACSYPDNPAKAPDVDATQFELSVYPIVLRDCGFPACHGAEGRFFRVYGPGRSRLRATSHVYDPPTDEEVRLSFARARSMLEGVDDIEDAPLLRKPLSLGAGGAGHEGDDGWGQSVYASTKNPAYRALRDWALSTMKGSR